MGRDVKGEEGFCLPGRSSSTSNSFPHLDRLLVQMGFLDSSEQEGSREELAWIWQQVCERREGVYENLHLTWVVVGKETSSCYRGRQAPVLGKGPSHTLWGTVRYCSITLSDSALVHHCSVAFLIQRAAQASCLVQPCPSLISG